MSGRGGGAGRRTARSGSDGAGPAARGPARSAGLAGRTAGGWRRLTGSASGTAIAFGVLALACSLAAVAGPRTSAQLGTTAFRQLAASAPALDTSIVGTLDAGSLGTATQSQVGSALLTRVAAKLRGNLAKGAPLAAPRSDWVGVTTPFFGFADHSPAVAAGVGTQFELAYRDDLSGHVRVLAGSLRAAVALRSGSVVVPIAITEAIASRYALKVGSRAPGPPGSSIVLQVTAIVAPVSATASFWQVDPLLTDPVLITPSNGPPYWQGGAFVSAAALPALMNAFSPSETQVTWVFGLALGRLTGAQAVSLAQSLPVTLGTAGSLGGLSQIALQTGGVQNVTLTSGAAGIIGPFAADDGAVGNVLDLMTVSLAVVGAAIVLLTAWLMAEKRREEFAVLRARGASRRQLGIAALYGSVIAAGPGAAVGIAAGLALTAGAQATLAWWLAGGTVAIALAGPVLITVRMHRGYAGVTRPDRPVRRITSVRRLVAEVTLVLGAAGGLIVLRHDSAGQAGGDLYASTAPILVAIPVAIILLRLYPLLLRPLLLLAGRRPGVTAFLGLARAARVSATSVLPAFAMVLAFSLVSFAGMVRGAVIRGEVAQSWQQAGADAVVTVPNALSAAQQRAIAAVPGVQRTVTVGLTTAARGFGHNSINAVVTDPAQYAALLAAAPLSPVPASFANWPSGSADRASTSRAAAGHGSAVPVLASASLATQLGRAPTVLQLQDDQRISVYVAGVAPAMSAVTSISGGGSAGYVVLPRPALHGYLPATSSLLVAGPGLDSQALLTTVSKWHVPGSQVTVRSSLLAALEQAPVERDAYSELAVGGYAAAAGCLLVLLLTLLLSARSRELTLARTATMGMSAGQARWLALIEALPQILSVLVGGLVCALALAPLVGPALALSVFTGSSAAVPVRIEPAWLTAAAVGLLVLAIATLIGQTVMASRGMARSLRIGE
jgi:putative ABC transport system permease protein